MSETSRKNIVTVDLAKSLQREQFGMLLAMGDAEANRIGAYITNGVEPVDITGYSVTGSFIRPDGVTVSIDGVADENMVYVDLPATCYVCEGMFSLALKISKNGVVQTVRMVDGYIRRTTTESISPDVIRYATGTFRPTTTILANAPINVNVGFCPKFVYAYVTDAGVSGYSSFSQTLDKTVNGTHATFIWDKWSNASKSVHAVASAVYDMTNGLVKVSAKSEHETNAIIVTPDDNGFTISANDASVTIHVNDYTYVAIG